MTLGERIELRRKEVGIPSQAELARRAGIGQSTMNGLIRKPYRWSPYLPQIARVLGTSVEYLVGEVDNAEGPASERVFEYQDRKFVDQLHAVGSRERDLILELTAAFARHAGARTIELPGERPLTAMFEALLAGINPSLPQDDKARLLAQRLPIALAQMQDLQPEPDTPASEEAVSDPAKQHHEQIR